MDYLPTNPLLDIPTDATETIRKIYNLDKPERLNEALDLLEEWIRKQTHFVKKDFCRPYLERVLISCKGSIEKAKKQLDNLCTMKTVLPKYFSKSNVKEELTSIPDIVRLLPLRKVTQDYYRVILLKINDRKFQAHHFMQYYQYNVILLEYLKKHDYTNGYILIEDWRNVNIVDILTKMNTVELQEFETLMIKCYGTRVKNLLLISNSKAVEFLVKFTKQFLSQKLNSRLNVVSDLQDLYKYIPREILPSDYGGMDKSMDISMNEWIEGLSSKEHVEYVKMMSKACTDESLRQADKFNEDYMGMPGSFRHLTVD